MKCNIVRILMAIFVITAFSSVFATEPTGGCNWWPNNNNPASITVLSVYAGDYSIDQGQIVIYGYYGGQFLVLSMNLGPEFTELAYASAVTAMTKPMHLQVYVGPLTGTTTLTGIVYRVNLVP